MLEGPPTPGLLWTELNCGRDLSACDWAVEGRSLPVRCMEDLRESCGDLRESCGDLRESCGDLSESCEDLRSPSRLRECEHERFCESSRFSFFDSSCFVFEPSCPRFRWSALVFSLGIFLFFFFGGGKRWLRVCAKEQQ